MMGPLNQVVGRLAMPSAYSRRMLYLYALGLIFALQLTSIVEALVGITISAPWKVALVVSVAPVLVVGLGVVFYPPREEAMPSRVWLPNALAMLVFWAGGYFLVGQLAGGGPFHSMEIPLDQEIPFRPAWVFVYVTVYPFFLFPLFYLDDPKDLLTVDLAQFLALTMSYVMFVVYPVEYPRAPLVETDFATWALSVVHGQDPAWNCFPSTHCTACTISSLSVMRSNPKLSAWAVLSTAAICISTLMTKQHFVLDVVMGVVLGVASFYSVKALIRRTTFGDWLAVQLKFVART